MEPLALARQQVLVDGLPRERVPEGVARHRPIGHNQVVCGQLTDRSEQRIIAEISSSGQQCVANPVPRRGRQPQHVATQRRQGRRTPQHQAADRGRNTHALLASGHELLGQERIAARPLVHPTGQVRWHGSAEHPGEQIHEVALPERPDVDPDRTRASLELGQPAEEPGIVGLVGPHRANQGNGGASQVAGQELEQASAGDVGPVKILDDQQEPCGLRGALEGAEHLLEERELGGRSTPVGVRGGRLCRRSHEAGQPRRRGLSGLTFPLGQLVDDVAESLGERCESQGRSADHGAGPHQRAHTSAAHASGHLCDQSGLACPRVTADEHRCRLAAERVSDELVEQT
jgi:hypothetical protein